MSDDGPRDFWRFRSSEKQPPPAHGIKIGDAGATWWGQRWVEALVRISAGYEQRMARGKTYARAGRTHDLVIDRGKVTAQVTGTRPQPYTVTIALVRHSDDVWKRVIEALTQKAQFAAELLAGRMPADIETAFHQARASLFPTKESDLTTECSCPDYANPCKHVAATHFVLGEAFDRDPFLLFELRGRSKEQLLEQLRRARGGKAGNEQRTKKAPLPRIVGVELKGVDPQRYDVRRAPLPALQLGFEAPSASGAFLRQLGAPASWTLDQTPVDRLGPIVRRASERALAIALAEPDRQERDEPR